MRCVPGRRLFRLVTLLIGVTSTPPVRAAIDLEWRPLLQTVGVSDIVEVGCYAVSDSSSDQSIGGVDIILTWDHEQLELLGHVDPCTAEPCDPNTYDWLQSGLPPDPDLDRINEDCGDDLFCDSILCEDGCPVETGCNRSTGFCNRGAGLFNDGDAFYRAFSRFRPNPPAIATPEGLLITTFQFRVVNPGIAQVRLEAVFGNASQTRVVDGDQAGVVVTGNLGPPATVEIESCPPPVVVVIGSRYLAVTPGPSIDPVALTIEGDPSDSAVNCLTMFVNPFGTLGTAPVYRSPEAWGTVMVGDLEIQPARTYRIWTDCTQSKSGLMSDVVEVTMWIWGDTDGNQDVEIADILRISNGVQGIFDEGTILENIDLMPCVPDGLINEADFTAVQEAFAGAAFPCPLPCSPGPTIDDLADFVSCLAGPDFAPPGGCDCDLNSDGACDLADYGVLQRIFDAP